MKKLKYLWRRVPKPLRVLTDLLAIAALSLGLYTFMNAPTISVEQDYRRAEKANMVGPAEILCDVELEPGFYSYQRMLVADAGDGLIFYCYDHWDFEDPVLIYREKTDPVTVLAAPYPNDSRDQTTEARLPVFVFDSCPEAVRAELDLEIRTELSSGPFQKSYRMEAAREHEGCFRFSLNAFDRTGLGSEGHAISRLVLLSGYGGRGLPDTVITAIVRLYDAQGGLIAEYETDIRSVIDLAHS